MLYVTRPKMSLVYVMRPKLPLPISRPTGNHMRTISTYISRACQKTPTTNLGSNPDVRRICPMRISIGNRVVPIRRKLMPKVLSTMRIFICTVQTDFSYLRLKSMQIYRVYEFINHTDCTQ